MRLVLLGLPGAGKGTQGERISSKYDIPHISTGSLIRSVIASGSELGKIADGYISKGNLIPDRYVIKMVRDRLLSHDCRNGWILDGFPRTVSQAFHLDSISKQDSMTVDHAFDIRISGEEAVLRIMKRRMCQKCGQIYNLVHYQTRVEGICDQCGGELYQRSDDNFDTAMHRLNVHMMQTHPVVHYYAQSGRLISVNGGQPIDLVFSAVDRAVLQLTQEKKAGEVS